MITTFNLQSYFGSVFFLDIIPYAIIYRIAGAGRPTMCRICKSFPVSNLSALVIRDCPGIFVFALRLRRDPERFGHGDAKMPSGGQHEDRGRVTVPRRTEPLI
jgi:hypothetical protein